MAINLRGNARSGAPVSVRNNNPGAIIYDPRNQWVGQTGFEETNGRKFVTFDSPENGQRAQLKLLANHIKGGADTPLKLFSKWAPKSDGNDPVAYATRVASSVGLNINDKIDPTNTDLLRKIAQGSGHVEAGTKFPGKYNNHEPLPDASPFSGYDPDKYYSEGLGVGNLDARRPLAPRRDEPITSELRRAGLGTPAIRADNTPTGTAPIQAAEQAEVDAEAKRESYGAWDRFAAGFENNSLSAALYRAIDRDHHEADPEWARHYADNSEELDKFAQNGTELATLRETTSRADYDQKMAQITAQRERQFIQYSGGTTSGVLWGLAGGIADPAGWVAGLGVGKAFQVAGVGARAYYLSGRLAQAGASLAAEGALGNVAVTAGLDLSGEHMTTSDYGHAAAFGMALGAAFAPLHLRGVRNAEIANTAALLKAGAEENLDKLRTRAVANIGEGASEGEVSLEMRRIDADDMMTQAREAMSVAEDEHRLAPPLEAQVAHMEMEHLEPQVMEGPEGEKVKKPTILPDGFVTMDTALRDRIVDKYGLDAIPDEATRAVAAEHYARAERLVGDNPINKAALKTILKAKNLESTSNTLLSSDNPLAQAWGISMLENGQGAAGRRATAAIEQNTRERTYLRVLAGYDNAFAMFRKGEGVGVMREVWTGDARKQFNRRVFAEIEARAGGTSTETNGAVRQAADMLEKGYTLMGADARAAGIVGHARIAETSRGYQPHRISAGKVVELMGDKAKRRAVAAIIARQLQHPDNAYTVIVDGAKVKRNWDKAFAEQFASKYLDDAARRAQGGWDIPVNIHDPMAAEVVMDTARAMNLPAHQADQLLGKFSRGGASFTKQRLRLNLLEDIGEGTKLMDLFNQDGLSLYRSYSRRMSGEVALANRGIMGKKGVEVYRDALRAGGADNETLRAFDQTVAEFLNTPFGEANHKYLDNVRVMTSVLRLGGMGFTQFGEYGNALATLGVGRTLESIGGFRRLANEVGQLSRGADSTNAILKDVDNWAGGAGVTEYHFTRLFDVPDNDIQPYNGETIGIGTRMVRGAGNLQAVLSGHRMITAVQVRGLAESMVRKAMEFVREGKSDAALLDAGISPTLQARLKANLDKVATFEGDKLRGLELHAGDLTPEEKQEFLHAIFRSANQMIQHTFTGETGRWAHNGMLKLLTQFRSFGVISIEKQWGRNMNNHGALKSFAYLIGAMSFAAPITLARLHLRTLGMSRTEREDYLKKNLTLAQLGRATMSYASASGIAGDVLDVSNGFASGWVGQDFAEGVGVRGQGQGSIVNMVPALGALEDAWKASHGDPHKILKLMPGGNLPFVQPVINGVAGPQS